MKKLSFLSTLLVTVLLSGCGTNVDSTNQNEGTNLSGNVADGYLIGAKVCIDENLNLACDENETYTITGENGYYEFSDINETQYPLVVEVTTDTIDSDTNETVDHNYTLSTNQENGGFISPITTIIHEYYLANAENNITIEDARAAIAAELDLNSTDQLFTDYMIGSQDTNLTVEQKNELDALHQELHSIAKLLVYTKEEIKDVIVTTLEQSGEEYNATEFVQNNDTLNVACNHHMYKELKNLKEDAKEMNWRDEDSFKEKGKHRGQNIETTSSDLENIVDDVNNFKKHRDRHENNNVSGTVSTGVITIPDTTESEDEETVVETEETNSTETNTSI
jgi:hypothetical protein